MAYRILCDPQPIFYHARRAHKLERKEYLKMTEEAAQAKKASGPLFGEEINMQRMKQFNKSILSFKKLPDDPNSLGTHQITHACEDLCLYKCPTPRCAFKHKLSQAVRGHLKRVHSVKLTRAEHMDWAQQVEVARFHRCILCSRTILCTLEVIKNHVIAGMHKGEISYDEYKRRAEEEEEKRTRRMQLSDGSQNH